MNDKVKQWGTAWLAGLIAGVVLLLGLSPLVFSGRLYLRPVAYFFGGLMTLNALGHIGGSVYLGELAPGTLSSPILLIAAVALLLATRNIGQGPANRDLMQPHGDCQSRQ